MKRLLVILPLVFAVLIGAFSVWGLLGDRNPQEIPSVLISEKAPDFSLPPIPEFNVPGLSTADLKTGKGPVLVNFFASWCVACKAEHTTLTRLVKDKGVTIYGVNYKDKAPDARAWLTELGNPYARIGFDLSGRAGIEWGISGVPETFVVDGKGVVVYRYVGPILGKKAQEKVMTALRQAGFKEPGS